MTLEEKREVQGWEGRYAVTRDGRVYSYLTSRFLRTPVGKRGYPCVNLLRADGTRRLRTVHTLVAAAFIPNPQHLPQVNHIDGDKTDPKAENLEWCSAGDNLLHARRTGLRRSDGDKAVVQKKNGIPVGVYKSATDASRRTGIGRSGICNVCNKRVSAGRHHFTAGGFEWEWF